MALKIIAAMAMNGVIGQLNGLPFRLASDMKRFREKTVGHPVVCGSTTYFSFPARFRPLPDRENIVLTRHPSKFKDERVTVMYNLKQLLERSVSEEIWVIGGAQVYRETLPYTQEIHLTRVQAIVPGDTYFPDWSWDEWVLVTQERIAADERNQYSFTWETWRRR